MNIDQLFQFQDTSSLFLIPLALFIVGVITYYFIKIVLERKGKEYGKALEHAKVPFILLFLIFGVYLSLRCIFEDTEALDLWTSIILVVLALFTASRISDGILFAILEKIMKKTKTKLDDLLLPLIKNAIHILLFILAICFVLSKLGYDVSALVAGLGVGGLALAFASKQMLENFFGGIVILIDHLFEIGDEIEVKGVKGKVKGIGLRSTIVEEEDGKIAVIPNSLIITNIVERKKMG